MPLTSMTGFADVAGERDGLGWTWEARSVNGRGLDLRLRLPDGFDALDAPVRAAAGRALARGSVTVTLRLGRPGQGSGPRLNAAALEAAVAAALAASDVAARLGLDLAPMTAAELLGVRGVLETEPAAAADDAELVAALAAGIEPLLARLAAARGAEGGGAGATLLTAQVDRIAALAEAARATAEARAGRAGALLRSRVEALLAAAAPVDEARLAQELALIAVKADVTEELDRHRGPRRRGARSSSRPRGRSGASSTS